MKKPFKSSCKGGFIHLEEIQLASKTYGYFRFFRGFQMNETLTVNERAHCSPSPSGNDERWNRFQEVLSERTNTSP